MKKYIITLFVSLMTIFSYGQSVYMHEAQQEAEENEISFGETILGAILFFGVIYVISKLSYRKSDSEHNHISNINPYDYSMDEKDREEEERQERDWKIKSQILDEIAFQGWIQVIEIICREIVRNSLAIIHMEFGYCSV